MSERRERLVAAPFERIGGRPPARVDVGDDLDCRGQAGAGRHPRPSRMRTMKIAHISASTTDGTKVSVTWTNNGSSTAWIDMGPLSGGTARRRVRESAAYPRPG